MDITKEQAIKIVTEFLTQTKQLTKEYSVTGAIFTESETLLRGNKKKIPVWTVSVHDSSIFDTTDFYIVSDLTGDLLYAQSKHGVTEIEKGSDGKFHWKD